jgi:hypothetical protein
VEDAAGGELGCCRAYVADGGAVCPPPELEFDVLPPVGYNLSVPAVVLPDIALLRLPVGAPKEPRL